jgi:hypothetical protein
MKDLKGHIFEKLRVTSKSDGDTIFDNMVHRTKRMSKSSFKSMFKKYGKPFELDRIYGDDLPLFPRFNYKILLMKYSNFDNTLSFVFYNTAQKKLFNRSVDDMDMLLEILGKGDIDKGNDVLWEIYDIMLNA